MYISTIHEKLELMPSEARLKIFEIHKRSIILLLIITIQIFSLCQKYFPCVTAKFPVFSLSGKSKNQIPCFPWAVATLSLYRYSVPFQPPPPPTHPRPPRTWSHMFIMKLIRLASGQMVSQRNAFLWCENLFCTTSIPWKGWLAIVPRHRDVDSWALCVEIVKLNVLKRSPCGSWGTSGCKEDDLDLTPPF